MSIRRNSDICNDPRGHAEISLPIHIKSAEVFVFRAPIDNPVITSFGVMRDRPAVLVRVEDAEGAFGWGEVWCNFPSCGAEHRARLLETVIAPMLIERSFEHPTQAYEHLSAATAVLAIQSGEPGPIAQVIAAADIALWDLVARREGLPLYRLLGGKEVADIPAYASGINLTGAESSVERCRAEGFTDFKVKVGMNREQDLATVRNVYSGLQSHESLMIDANQAWDLPTAMDMVEGFADIPLQFLEEPLRAVQPLSEWETLKAHSRIPLAAGENLGSFGDFERAINSGAFAVIQPDLCKWGGISGCLPVAQKAIAAQRRYCPHYLGGGIGLMASAHLLAAVGGDGLLEVDSNPNPLRQLFADPYPRLAAGRMTMTSSSGLGVDPDITGCKDFLVSHTRVAG